MVKPIVISSSRGLVQKKLPKQSDDLNASTFSLEKSILDDKTTLCRKHKKEELTDIHQEAVSISLHLCKNCDAPFSFQFHP